MPRRRSCLSIISARCGAYSLFSSIDNRCGMFFPCPCFKNLFHLRKCKVALILAIIEVRRDAHAGFGAVVDDDFSCEEFAADFISMRAFDRNRSRALRRIVWRVHTPATRASAL